MNPYAFWNYTPVFLGLVPGLLELFLDDLPVFLIVPQNHQMFLNEWVKSRPKLPALFLDCGAFSNNFSEGRIRRSYRWRNNLDVTGLAHFLEDGLQCPVIPVAFDCLGFGDDSRSSRHKFQALTLASYHEMKQAGLSPVFTIHFGDSFEHLDQLIRAVPPSDLLVGLGGFARDRNSFAVLNWIKTTNRYLWIKGCKTHIFGRFQESLLAGLSPNVASFDASTHVQLAVNQILMFKPRDGPSIEIQCGEKAGMPGGLLCLPESIKGQFHEFLTSFGLDPLSPLSKTVRVFLNIQYFLQMAVRLQRKGKNQ